MATVSSRRARGRPRVPDEARKRNNVTIRMRDELRSKIEQNATAQQRSISEEIETRLERSFAEEDRFGGPAMVGIVNMLVGAFLSGGQRCAAASGHPEWTPADWLKDRDCYRAAALAVGFALNLPLPTTAPMSDPGALHDLMLGMIAAQQREDDK
jgi:Arc-like DNA binding domain